MVTWKENTAIVTTVNVNMDMENMANMDHVEGDIVTTRNNIIEI